MQQLVMWPSGSKRLAKARVTGGHSVPIGKISQPLLRPTKAPPPLSFCKEGEVLSGNSKASDIHQTSCDFAGRDRVWLSLKKGWEVAGNTRIVTKENRTRQKTPSLWISNYLFLAPPQFHLCLYPFNKARQYSAVPVMQMHNRHLFIWLFQAFHLACLVCVAREK